MRSTRGERAFVRLFVNRTGALIERKKLKIRFPNENWLQFWGNFGSLLTFQIHAAVLQTKGAYVQSAAVIDLDPLPCPRVRFSCCSSPFPCFAGHGFTPAKRITRCIPSSEAKPPLPRSPPGCASRLADHANFACIRLAVSVGHLSYSAPQLIEGCSKLHRPQRAAQCRRPSSRRRPSRRAERRAGGCGTHRPRGRQRSV